MKILNVVRYLNSNDDSLNKLTEEYGIKVTQNPKYPDLYCLNYNQIESPKLDPITLECRSLVLELHCGEFSVISQSFGRFFNYGETGTPDCDISELVAFDKIDGSLAGYFYYQGEWLYRTRGMIMPEEGLKINRTELTWKELFEETVVRNPESLDTNVTYILEVTSPENRVVTRYHERKAFLLAVRNNNTGDYETMRGDLWDMPKMYTFGSFDECKESAQALRDLNEGYVMYTKDGVPVMKLKNPAYVAAHHIRGESALSPRRVMDLIFMNEHEEYLTIFEEDTEFFTPYIEGFANLSREAYGKWVELQCLRDNRKGFALAVKGLSYNGFLFKRLGNPSLEFKEWFDSQFKRTRYSILEQFIQK